MSETLALAAGRLELESIVRAPLVVITDPVVAASGEPATIDEVAGSGGGVTLLERPAGTILAFANPSPDFGLFVWAARDLLAVVADPDHDAALAPVGELTVCSGRLVVGAPEVVAAWGPDVDTGDGSSVRARVHRGRQRLGLIVVSVAPTGQATVSVGTGAAAIRFPLARAEPTQLRLAG